MKDGWKQDIKEFAWVVLLLFGLLFAGLSIPEPEIHPVATTEEWRIWE